MLPDRVSNPGPLTYESGALPIALRGPAIYLFIVVKFCWDLNIFLMAYSPIAQSFNYFAFINTYFFFLSPSSIFFFFFLLLLFFFSRDCKKTPISTFKNYTQLSNKNL